MAPGKQRVVSLKVYVFTFILAVIIFALGIFIGTTFENERQKVVDQDIIQYQSDLENVVVQYDLIEQGGSPRCELYPELFKGLYTELDTMGKTLEDYQSQGKFMEFQFEKIKQRYTTLSIRTWLLLENVRRKCDQFSTVLYFYSSNQCEDCLSQGVVLDALKKKYGSHTMIFPIDADYSNPSVTSLTTFFNVTAVPTIIVNSNTTFVGMTDREPIENAICATIQC